MDATKYKINASPNGSEKVTNKKVWVKPEIEVIGINSGSSPNQLEATSGVLAYS